MDEFNKNLDEYRDKIPTFSFAMFRYKTSWCPKIGQKHDWAQWIYAHRLQDFRRPPDMYEYSSEDCSVIVHKDCSWENWRDGLYCKYSHTTFERLYHPSKFKLVPCEKKIWGRAEMWAFFHNPDEKIAVEAESENFFDPFHDNEDYECEGEYSPEMEEEYDNSEEKSHKSDQSNTNTNTNIISQELGENNSETVPPAKLSLSPSDKFPFEDDNEENAWANEEFGLENALKRTPSQTLNEDFEAKTAEHDPNYFPTPFEEEKSIPPEFESPTLSTKAKDQAREEKEVSSEIKSIVLGNDQQITTSKIVQNIMSEKPSTSKSKFFNVEETKDNDEDLINEIYQLDFEYSQPGKDNFNTYFNTFSPPEEQKSKKFNSSLFNSNIQEFSKEEQDKNGFSYNVSKNTENFKDKI